MIKMGTGQYYHTRSIRDYPDYGTTSDGETITNIEERVIRYGLSRKKVLAVQKHSSKLGHYVIIPGYITKERFKTNEGGVEISEVEIIPEKKHKRVRKIIRKSGLKGKIEFWS